MVPVIWSKERIVSSGIKNIVKVKNKRKNDVTVYMVLNKIDLSRS